MLIVIYIFVGIKIIVTCSAHIRKGADKIVSKEMLQTCVDIFPSKEMAPYVSMRKLQKINLGPQSHRNEMMSDNGALKAALLTNQRQLDKRLLSAGTSREASGVPCLNPRRGLTLLSPVCRDPAIGV